MSLKPCLTFSLSCLSFNFGILCLFIETWTHQSVRPDLTKFNHLGKISKLFGQFLNSIFSSWQNIKPNGKDFIILSNLHCYNWPNIKQ